MVDGRNVRAEKIRVLRARLKLSQHQVAVLAGIDQTTVSKAELGRASVETFDRIDAALAAAVSRPGRAEP